MKDKTTDFSEFEKEIKEINILLDALCTKYNLPKDSLNPGWLSGKLTIAVNLTALAVDPNNTLRLHISVPVDQC